MASNFQYRATLIRKDGTQEQLGDITLTKDEYGGDTEQEAMDAFLSEMLTTGGYTRFRGLLFPSADVQTIRIELVQASDLSGSLEPE